MENVKTKNNLIEDALKYAMSFYCIQEHELIHDMDQIKRYIADFFDGHNLNELNSTESKLVLLAWCYLKDKKRECSDA